MSGADSLSSSTASPSAFQLFKYDFNKSLDDGWDLLRAPAHFTAGDWAITGTVIGGTALSMLLDNDVRHAVRRNQTGTLDDITKAGKYYGEVVPAVSLSAGIYAAGLIFNERSVSLTGRLLAESLLYAGTINVLLKMIFSRSRPYTNNGNTDFGNYSFNNDFHSLPSGHTTVAFTVSTVLAERINNVYASIGLYSLAALTAYQRIYSDNHWFSDTLFGAALGFVVSRAVVRLNETDPYEDNLPEITAFPINGGFSLGVNFHF
jgi:membrane-associated phospholipid phosphatase